MAAEQHHSIGNNKADNHNHEIIGHLHVVARNLEHGEQSRQCTAREIASAVGKHHSGYGGRYIGQCIELPYVSGAYDDYEVGRHAVGNSANQRKIPSYPHGQQQDKESHHHYKQQIDRRGQPQPIGRAHCRYHLGGRIVG